MRVPFAALSVSFLLLTACSSPGLVISMRGDRQQIEVEDAGVKVTVEVKGEDAGSLALDDFTVALNSGHSAPLVQEYSGRYSYLVTGITDAVDGRFVTQVKVRGVLASLELPVVATQAQSISLVIEPLQINADVGRAMITAVVTGAFEYAVADTELVVYTSSGLVSGLRQVSAGYFEAQLEGLNQTALSPVTVSVVSGAASATSHVTILVGDLGGFEVSLAPLPAEANTSIMLTVRATDGNGNFRSAYDGNVTIKAFAGTGAEIPVFPVRSNTFARGELSQSITLQESAESVRMEVADGSSKGSLLIGDVAQQPVRCIEVRREGLKSRIFTADEGGDPNGVVFDAYLYMLDCDGIQAALNRGENLLPYTIQGVEPLAYLVDQAGKVVGRSDLVGHDASDKVGDLKSNLDGFYEIPLYGLTNVDGSPFQLIVTVGKVVSQTQVEITPGVWDSLRIDPIPDVAAGFPFGVYIGAVDLWQNLVLTETSQVRCNYASSPLTDNAVMPPMTLGQVSFAITAPTVTGANSLRCWRGSNAYAASLTRGTSLPFDVRLATDAALVNGWMVVLPGQTFVPGNPPDITGSPDNQIAGVPFNVDVVALPVPGAPLAPIYDGTIYLDSLLGTLQTVDSAGQPLSASPLSQTFKSYLGNFNPAPYTQYSFLRQKIVLDNAGTQAISVNPVNPQVLPLPFPRSNIGLLDTNIPPNTSEFFQIVSGVFDRFVVQGIPSPQTVNQAFLLTVEAVDSGGNRLNGYNAVAAIGDQSGTVSSDNTRFDNGLLQTWVTVSREWLNDSILVSTGDGESVRSPPFDVRGTGYIGSFLLYGYGNGITRCEDLLTGTLPPSAGHQIADVRSGDNLRFFAVARGQDGSVVDFSWPVALTDSSKTVSPLVTDRFVNGCLDQTVHIRKAGSTALSLSWQATGNSAAGTSNFFVVTPGDPDHIVMSLGVPGPILRDTGLLPVSYKVVDLAGNTVVSFANGVTINDNAGALVGAPFVDVASGGTGSFNVTFSSTAVGDRVTAYHNSSQYPGPFSGYTEPFDVIVMPDAFDVVVAAASVTAYEPFSVAITAMLGGGILPEFVQSVTLSAQGNGTVSPASSPNFVAGAVTLQATIRATFTGNTRLRATFVGPSQSVTGESLSFAVANTAFVGFGAAPVRVDDGGSFSLPVTVYSSAGGGTVMTAFGDQVDFGIYGTVSGSCTTGVQSLAATMTPGNSTLVNGKKNVLVTFSLTNAQVQFVPQYVCVGAQLPGASRINYTSEIVLCGPNVNPFFDPNGDCN